MTTIYRFNDCSSKSVNIDVILSLCLSKKLLHSRFHFSAPKFCSSYRPNNLAFVAGKNAKMEYRRNNNTNINMIHMYGYIDHVNIADIAI